MEDSVEFDLKGLSVCFAIPAYDGKVPVDLMAAFIRTLNLFQAHNVKVTLLSERENGLVDSVRNRLVHRFLNETDCQKLFWIDSDIVWNPDDALRLLALSTKNRIVAGTYQARKDPPTYFLGLLGPEQDEFGLLDITGCGFGFIITDRDVFLKQKEHTVAYLDKQDMVTRYFAITCEPAYENPNMIQYKGEDMYFLNRSYYKFGEKIKLDPSIQLKHYGTKEYTSDPLLAIRKHFNKE